MRINRLRWLVGSVVAASLIAGCGGDSTGPRPTSGLSIKAGANASDTIGAVLTQALIVEVRDSTGKEVSGTVVRFSALPNDSLPYQVPLAVANLNSDYFSSFVSDSTNTHGQTGTLVELGGIAGRQGVVITVPARGLADTAWFTVKPGHAARFAVGVNDTAVTVGNSWNVGARVMDRVGNLLPTDSVTYTSLSSEATVTTTGQVTAATVGRYAIEVRRGTAVDTSHGSVVPPGKLVAVRATNGVYTMNFDGTNVTQLVATNDYSLFPQWSPDGTRIAIYEGAPYNTVKLSALSLTGTRTPIVPAPASTAAGAAFMRPDMNGLLYFSGPRVGTGAMTIWRMNADGSGLVALFMPTDSYSFTHPAPSPDGKTVLYDVDQQGIMSLDVATKTVHALGLQGFFPVYSPDGTRIAYLTGASLKIANSDATGSRTLWDSTYVDVTTPSWSTDGHWILAPKLGGGAALVRVSDGLVLPLPSSVGFFQWAIH